VFRRSKCDHTILPFVGYEVRQTCKESSFQDTPSVGPSALEVLLEYPLSFERVLNPSIDLSSIRMKFKDWRQMAPLFPSCH
jgi:hypothetical protein